MGLACRLSRFMALSLAILLSACLPVTAGDLRPPCSPVNVQLSPAQFDNLARHCAPAVSPEIMRALAKTESAMYPYVLSINYPETSARRRGYDGKVLLLRQPRSKTEAIHWAKWYLSQGYTVSIGLVQVNVEMAPRLKSSAYGSLRSLHKPCRRSQDISLRLCDRAPHSRRTP
jgi:hypothetical protein